MSRWMLPILLVGFSMTPAALAAVVSLSSPEVTVEKTFQLQLRVSGAGDLYGLGADLVYDPRHIAIEDADGDPVNGVQPAVWEGSVLDGARTTSTVRAEALQDGQLGRLVVALARRGRVTGASIAGEQTILTVGLRALAVTTTTVRLENLVVQESQSGAPIPATTSGGSVSIVIRGPNRPPTIPMAARLAVRPGRVILDAGDSSDPDGDLLTYRWRQLSGPAVTLSSNSAPAVHFTSLQEASFRFSVDVSDGLSTSTALVDVAMAGGANTPPRAVAIAPSAALRGVASLAFSLIDAEGDSASVAVSYSLDGGTSFSAATAAQGGPALTDLSASPAGSPHSFLWNTLADLGTTRRTGVVVRVSPLAGGQAGDTTAFVVDNVGLGVVARILGPAAGSTSLSGESITLRGEAFDADGSRLPGGALAYSSDRDGGLGSGSTVVATLRTAGDHVVTLTATGAAGTGVTTRLLRVDPAPTPPLRMAFTGRIVSDRGTPAPDGSRIVLLNPARGVSGSGRVAGGNGSYDAALASLSAFVVSPGDSISVDFIDEQGVPRALTPAGFTVSTADVAARLRVQDFVFTSSTTVSLVRGLNLIALPASPGTTADPYTVAELLTAADAAWAMRTRGGRFEVYLADGLGVPWNIQGNEGYLVLCNRTAPLSFTGIGWPVSQRSWEIERGLNAIAFPAGVPAGFTFGDVLTLTGGGMLVEFEPDATTGRSRARAFLRQLDSQPRPVRLGRGYLVSSTGRRTVPVPQE